MVYKFQCDLCDTDYVGYTRLAEYRLIFKKIDNNCFWSSNFGTPECRSFGQQNSSNLEQKKDYQILQNNLKTYADSDVRIFSRFINKS